MTIPNSQRSVGPCCRQIELVPSRRAAVLAAAWLMAASAAVMGGVALSLPARIMIGAAILASGIAGIRSRFLLQGRRALERIHWDADGFTVRRRFDGIELSAILESGSFR